MVISGCGSGQVIEPTKIPSPTNTPVPTNTPTPLRPTSTSVPPTATALSTGVDVTVSVESMKLIQAWKGITAFTPATNPINNLSSLQGNQIGLYKIEPSGVLPTFVMDLVTILINENNPLAAGASIYCPNENDPFGTCTGIRLFITDDPKIITINGAAKINFVTKK